MRVWIPVVAVALVGCSSVLPLDKPPSDAGGDVAVVEAGGDGPAADGPAQEAGTTPDAALPDTWPRFDGLTTCKTLWAAPVPIQVSDAAAGLPASSPSIAAIGNDFYIAFVEGDEVQVRRVSPFGATPLGTITRLSSIGPTAIAHQDPWIAVTDSSTGTLIATWSEPTKASACSGDLVSREMNVSGGQIGPVVNPCNLSVSYALNGYVPSAIAAHNGTYVVIAKVEYQGTACDSHTKGVVQSFPAPGCNVLTTPYNLALGTKHVVVGAALAGATPWEYLRVHEVTTETYALYRATSANGSFGGESPVAQPILRVRPALAGDADGYFFEAWVSNAGGKPGLMLGHSSTGQTITPITPTSTSGGYTAPGLAYEVVTDRALLVYTDLDASATPAAVRASLVGLVGSALDVGAPVPVSGAAVSAAAEPRVPVVAAGSGGFGVAWVENVSGNSEVMFNWVGCRP